MMAAAGCAVANQVSQTARTSSPKLKAQLLSGSGEIFTAARALAFVPCEVRAMPPATRAAAQRQGSGAAAVGLKARRAAGGGRVKGWGGWQVGWVTGAFSGGNSMRLRKPALGGAEGVE